MITVLRLTNTKKLHITRQQTEMDRESLDTWAKVIPVKKAVIDENFSEMIIMLAYVP